MDRHLQEIIHAANEVGIHSVSFNKVLLRPTTYPWTCFRNAKEGSVDSLINCNRVNKDMGIHGRILSL